MKYKNQAARIECNALFNKMHKEGAEKWGWDWIKVNEIVVNTAIYVRPNITGFDFDHDAEKFFLTFLATRICNNLLQPEKVKDGNSTV